jgi:hypothetical protein
VDTKARDEGQEARTAELADFGLAVAEVGHALMGRRRLSVDVASFSVRGPRKPGDDILVTLRGFDGEGTPVVAFFGGASLGAIFVSIDRMLYNGIVKWRPDQYAGK